MKKLHLIVGSLLVVAFLLTGQYMDKVYNHMHGVPDAPRLLFRTRHIFILFTALLNLAIGAYFAYAQEPWQRTMQVLGSILIFSAAILFIVAFFYEPRLSNLHTPLSHWGAYAVAAGTVLHVIASVERRNINKRV